tara:strand:+ start:2517 stop:3584 length:1068 start_codon:yes stop_codon:yes gene_type:complete
VFQKVKVRTLPFREGWLAPPSIDSRPLASAFQAKDADIIVSCYDNWTDHRHAGWGNLVDAARRATPGGSCVWDGVAFVRGEWPMPDWHLILNNLDWERQNLRFWGRPNRTVFAVCEPPTSLHRPWHFAQGDGTIVLTCDEIAASTGPPSRRYQLEPSLTPSWTVDRSIDYLRANPTPEKTRSLSWICSAENAMPGHNFRLDFLRRLQNQVEFDHFGRGFKPITDKWDGLAPYRYSIAFENFQDDWYFTEKLGDCFVAETMPIYYGSPAITRFFPEDSLLILDPDDPDVIRIIQDAVKSKRWEQNLDAIREAKRLVLEEHNVFARLARFFKRETDKPDRLRPLHLTRIDLDYTALA